MASEKQKDIFDINNIKYIFQVPSCPRTNSMASTDFDEDDDDEEDDDELTDGYYLFRCLLIKWKIKNTTPLEQF